MQSVTETSIMNTANMTAPRESLAPAVVHKNYIPCNLCGSTDYEVLYSDELEMKAATVDYNFCPDTRKTYQIVKCPKCGIIYTNPMPSIETSYHDTKDETYLRSKKQRVRTAEHLMKKILCYKSGGRLLDVGCSTGIQLDAASKHFDVEGIELSHWAYREASSRHKVHNVTLSELDLCEQFDVVTLIGVIEHFEDPVRELQLIHRALKPGGLFVIYTGDVDAWLPRLLGKKWWWYQGMHVFYFSLKTCKAMLDKCGFKVIRNGMHCSYFEVYSLGNSLKRYKLGLLLNPLFNLPGIKNLMIPVKLSGEMLLFATKVGE